MDSALKKEAAPPFSIAPEERHAYLIAAHAFPALLQELINALDNPYNDIFIHVDAKADSSMDPKNFSSKEAGLFFTERIPVYWSGDSQVFSILILLEEALEHGPYMYCHFLTGDSYPLRSQAEIRAFFKEHRGTEFIDLEPDEQFEQYYGPYYSRLAHYWPFQSTFRTRNTLKTVPTKVIRRVLLRVQDILHIDRFKRFGLQLAKGQADWSITQKFAEYVLSKKDLITQMMRYTKYGDEELMQVLLVNSPFSSKRNVRGEVPASMVLTTWELEELGLKRPHHRFALEDYDYLIESPALYARKFSGPDGLTLIEMLRRSFTED